MTPKIHADPPKFRQVAEDLRRIADELLQGGSKLLSATADARSYDGQYAPWVQSIALDGDKSTRTLSEKIDSLAHTLDRIARAFEEADRLDQRGFPYLAAQFRSIIESGYDTSSFPSWLIRGQRPPWFHPKFWNRLPPDDRDAILSSIGGAWLEFMQSGDYTHGLKEDTWNAFLVYLYFQGTVFKPPEHEVWISAARAAGVDLEVYVSDVTGIRQTNVEAWFGAAEMHDFSQEFAIHEMAAMAKAGESIEDHFGFSMVGDWTEGDEDATFEGVLLISHAMARVTPELDTAAQIYQEVFGGTTFTLKTEGEEDTWYCTAGGFGHLCEPLSRGHMSPQLTIHELGHTFNARIHNHLEVTDHDEREVLRPYTMLEDTQIVDNLGNHVTGEIRPGVFQRTEAGYVIEDNRRFPWQQHPIGWEGGNTPNEDFADMFLNWAFDSFDYSVEAMGAGEARYNWMEENMTDWISYVTEPFDNSWLP